MAELSEVELLNRTHRVDGFDCGTHESLNTWLRKYALQNQGGDSARTYVVHRDLAVVGYYALAAGSVAREQASRRVVQGLAKHPVPVVLLGRLAVDRGEQGKGLGRKFYERFDFEPCPGDDLHLMLLMKDLRLALRSRK